jgi:CheY-like chemotaxis protein
VPVVMLTERAMAEDRDRFLEAGMDGYLAKPFTVEQLNGVLRQFGGELSALAGRL